jgi:hypothetical protein
LPYFYEWQTLRERPDWALPTWFWPRIPNFLLKGLSMRSKFMVLLNMVLLNMVLLNMVLLKLSRNRGCD